MATSDALEPTIPAASAETGAETPLSAVMLPLYLLGNRRAIVCLAESRAAVWIGLLFVLSAGFAREYDGADLIHEPWHLALPLVASLGTSLVLYGLVYIAARNRGVKALTFWQGYRTLLTFYWWTAPLAWLYAIPVERFMSAGEATQANLWLLALVSVWRVLLITRALSVWLGAGFIGMYFIVMFFADTVAVALAIASPKPIFNIMGGVRLSDPDRAFLDATMMVIVFGSMSWLAWLIGAVLVIARNSPPWTPAVSQTVTRGVSASLWIAAGLLMLLGIGLLPFFQYEQQHKSQLENLLHSGDVDAAVAYATQFSRGDFPPVWDPPPRLGYNETKPSPIDVLETVEAHQGPEWFRKIYADKLAQDPSGMLWANVHEAGQADAVELERVFGVLERNVPVELIDSQELYDLRSLTENDDIDPKLRERLRAYIAKRIDESE